MYTGAAFDADWAGGVERVGPALDQTWTGYVVA